jgi:hypothetical protein
MGFRTDPDILEKIMISFSSGSRTPDRPARSLVAIPNAVVMVTTVVYCLVGGIQGVSSLKITLF